MGSSNARRTFASEFRANRTAPPKPSAEATRCMRFIAALRSQGTEHGFAWRLSDARIQAIRALTR
jgi:hypothetical protein